MASVLPVLGLSGPLCEVSADPSWAMGDVKAAVEFETGIPRCEQRLLLGTLELCDSELVGAFPEAVRSGITLVRAQPPPEQVEWLSRVASDGLQLRGAPASARADAAVVLAAVRANGLALEFAAAELRAERGVVLAAVQENGWALRFAAPGLQRHPEVRSVARRKMRETMGDWVQKLRENGLMLEDAPAYLRAEKELVLTAVKQSGCALRFAASELQQDRDVVKAAVREHGRALRHAADELRADSDVVLEAVKANGFALEFATGAARSDRSVVLAAMRLGGEEGAAVLPFAPDELRTDREIVLAAMGCSSNFAQMAAVLLRAGLAIRADREVILAAVRCHGGLLALASDELRSDIEIATIALRQSKAAIGFLSKELHGHPALAGLH